MTDIVTKDLGGNMCLHIIPDKKFKTVYISYCFHMDLDENYTYNALVPAVLKRGCQGFEDQKKIGEFLEEQYGALFDVGVQKLGERQILRFTMDIVNEAYIGQDKILAQSLFFLNRIITRPILEEGLFKGDYVAQEKENLKNRIGAMINDKMQYSMERCIQEMCRGEKYARYVHGNIEDLESLDPNKLYRVYEDMIATAPLDIFVVGDVDPDKVEILVKNSLDINRTKTKIIPETTIKRVGIKQREVTERMNLTQAKLNIGFRTNTLAKEKDYPALMVYAGILGGGPHSKLFINVREKASLAYYSFARLDKYKGLMLIGSGIEGESYDDALGIIMDQVKDMEHGKISETELNSTINALTTSFMGAKDQPELLVGYYLGNHITSAPYTIDEFIEKIQKVTLEDVVEVSKKVKVDTIYLLSPKEGTLEDGKDN